MSIMLKIPALSSHEKIILNEQALISPRRRAHKVMHKSRSYHNEVFCGLLRGTYMRPHLHGSDEKIEYIYILDGKLGVVFFDKDGKANDWRVLDSEVYPLVRIPAFTWHTYIPLSDFVLTFETMDGIYEPSTWKDFPAWAPEEGTAEALVFAKQLEQLF
jgi:cupin fold WbuC family metalloprotein